MQVEVETALIHVLTSCNASQVELVKMTRQQISTVYLLEIYRGSLSQFVCPYAELYCIFNYHFILGNLFHCSDTTPGQET